VWTATPQWRDGQASKHLIRCELFDELRPAGFKILPGEIGENITTRGIDLLALQRNEAVARQHGRGPSNWSAQSMSPVDRSSDWP
jgi:hypothetical protein